MVLRIAAPASTNRLTHLKPLVNDHKTASSTAQDTQTLSSRALQKRREVDLEAGLGALPQLSSLQPPEPSHPAPARFGQTRFPSPRRSLRDTFFPSLKPQQPAVAPQPPSSRLWNPINHVPRPTLVPLPRSLPVSDTAPQPAGQREIYPLLSIPEQRRSRRQSPTSLLVEHSPADADSGHTSIGVPNSRRKSGNFDEPEMGGATAASNEKDETTVQEPDQAHLATTSTPTSRFTPKDRDIELGLGQKYGMGDEQIRPPRHAKSQHSLQSGGLSSYASVNGMHSNGHPPETEDVAEELAWGPSHPCFPHLNPHVPVTSPEYASTRIIRVRRDWMVVGDLAPTFSNLYPEILDSIVPESEFRNIIARLNEGLVTAFDPYSARNWIDGILGVLTGWVWEDIGASGIKGKLRSLENWITNWNGTFGATESVKIISLRRTAYMSLDIQIPDPQVGVVGSEQGSRTGTRPSTAGKAEPLEPSSLVAQ